jgi:O-antigen ligase
MQRIMGVVVFAIGIFFALTGSWEVAIVLGLIGLVYIFVQSKEAR